MPLSVQPLILRDARNLAVADSKVIQGRKVILTAATGQVTGMMDQKNKWL